MSELLRLFGAERTDPDRFELDEAVGEWAQRSGWSEPLAEAMAILAQSQLRAFWHQAMCVVFWAQPAGKSEAVRLPPGVEAMDCVARLYLCLEREPSLDDNLVWSIAHTLKGVGYLSDWDPLQDRDVTLRMAQMRLLP